MDSKLKRLMLMGVFLVFVLVGVLVWNENKDKFAAVNGKPGNNIVETKAPSNDSFYTEVRNGQIGDDLQGFLRDKDFFDSDERDILGDAIRESKMLTVKTYSLKNDLRIRFFDYLGKEIHDTDFAIELEGLGEYVDYNFDGVIIAEDIPEGSYKMNVTAMGDYYLEDTEFSVEVKAMPVAERVPDISLFIKNHGEVPETDNIFKNLGNDENDRDKTEIKKLSFMSNAETGVVVSSENGDIDWKKVSDAGVSFAIIRIGLRGEETNALIIDSKFEENLKNAKLNGLSVGVYFQSRALEERDVIEEASMVLEVLDERLLTLPAFIDCESFGVGPDGYEVSLESRTSFIQIFTSIIDAGGYTPGLYGSKSFLEREINAESISNAFVWMAEYRSIPTYNGFYDCWQYTSKAKVSGINGQVKACLLYTGN